MWRCLRCETDNSNADILCNGCDWHSPEAITIHASLMKEVEKVEYLINWVFDNAIKITVDNDMGEVLSTGEFVLTIKKKTTLIFLAVNEFAEKTFVVQLELPAPFIEIFSASKQTINIHKSILLFWIVKYYDKIILSEFGEVTGVNEKRVSLKKTSTLVLTAKNETGTHEQSIDFVLPPPFIYYLRTNRKKVVDGDEVMLSWRTTNAEILTLSGLRKEEILTGNNKRIILDKTVKLALNAINNSGTTTKEIVIEVLPRPQIIYFKLNHEIALVNDKVEVTWKATNFSKLFLLVDDDVFEVSDKTSWPIEADKTKNIKLICESIEKLTIISRIITLKVIEKVRVDYLVANSLITIQSKPIVLRWSVKNATDVFLLPIKKRLEMEGAINILPSIKTVYIVEAKNELTVDSKEIEIDVLPLPSISNIRLAIPPKIELPSFHENRIKYAIIDNPKRSFLTYVKFFFLKKLIAKESRLSKIISISLTQRSETIQINRKTSLMNIVSSIKEFSS